VGHSSRFSSQQCSRIPGPLAVGAGDVRFDARALHPDKERDAATNAAVGDRVHRLNDVHASIFPGRSDIPARTAHKRAPRPDSPSRTWGTLSRVPPNRRRETLRLWGPRRPPGRHGNSHDDQLPPAGDRESPNAHEDETEHETDGTEPSTCCGLGSSVHGSPSNRCSRWGGLAPADGCSVPWGRPYG